MPTRHGVEDSFTRVRFLRTGVAVISGSLLVTGSAAQAAAPAPTPQGDDVSYVQLTATAELVSVSLGAAILLSPAFSPADKRRVRALRASDKEHFARLAAVLGPDAPQFGDFHIALPPPTQRTRARLLGTALALSGLLAGVYLSGVTDAGDPATRELLGRLLWSEAQHLSTLHAMAGRSLSASGLPGPVSLDDAAGQLDAFLGDADPPA